MSVTQFIQRIKPNDSKMKALFIRGKQGMRMQEILFVAKAEARKLGMKDVNVLDILFSYQCGGWTVIVQNKK